MATTDFDAIKAAAIDSLCKKADAGLPEVLYLLDMDSGEILDYQEATKEVRAIVLGFFESQIYVWGD